MAGAHAAAEHADHSVEIDADDRLVAHCAGGHRDRRFLYLKRTDMPATLAAKYPGVYEFLLHKGYVDELYDGMIVQPIKALSENVLWRLDARVIDGAVNGMGQIVVETGALIRQIQTGSMRTYAVSVLLGAVVIVGYYLWS